MRPDNPNLGILPIARWRRHDVLVAGAQMAALAALYFLTGKLGLRLAIVNESATAVWPPTGIALAAALLFGRRIWPGIWVGAFLVNITTTVSMATAMGLATGNTLEAVVGAWLVDRFANGRHAFDDPRHTLRFILYAVFFSTGISATIGATSLALGGFPGGGQFTTIWKTWWLGDMVSAAIIAPFILIWSTVPLPHRSGREVAQFVGLLSLTIGVGLVVFGGILVPPLNRYPLAFLCFPVLMCAGFVFEARGAASAAFLLSVAALWGTLRGVGPFAVGEPHESLMLVQGFMATITLTNLMIGAVITGRRRDQESLREGEARKSAILESSLDCIISMDDQGRIVDFNQAAERTFGHRRAQVIGQTVAETIVPPRFRDSHRRGLARFLDTGEGPVLGRRVEFSAMQKDGNEIPIELAVTASRVGGHPVFFTAYLRDISERKRAEQRRALELAVSQVLAQAATSEEALARILQSVCETLQWNAAAIWTVDRECQVLRCRHFWRGTASAMPRFEAATKAQTFRIGVGLPGRVWATGQPAWISDVVKDENFPRAPFAEADGLHGAFGFPITIGGEAFGMMEFFSASIEQPDDAVLAMMATVGAHIGQFLGRKRAEEAVVEADRRKDQFLATLSHELRTPLSSILGWAQMLKKSGPDSGTFGEGIAVIERNAKAQAQLISELLDMSGIVSGKVRLDLQDVDPGEIVEIAVKTARPSAEAKGVELRLHRPPEEEFVRADPGRLQQVVGNILANAIKFTPKNGRIDVRLERERSDVVISVADTGEGIAPEFLPFIFDRFRQADASTARRYGGLGLGLAIVKHLIEMHGGAVRAESAGPGKGTTMRVSLPVRVRATTDAPGTPAEKAPTQDGKKRLAGTKVLVVEDEPDSRSLVQWILERAGAQVIAMDSAADALASLNGNPPDVIVSDIGMPVMDGFDFLRSVRQRGVRIPAVALTAFAGENDKRMARQAGYDEHLAKPIDPEKLVSTLARLIRPVHSSG